MSYIYDNTAVEVVDLQQLTNELTWALKVCKGKNIIINSNVRAIFDRKRYSEGQTALKSLQYFCNAHTLETKFINCNTGTLSFITLDHDIVSPINTGEDKPDFRIESGELAGKTVELKIFQSKDTMSFNRVHKADYVICYLIQTHSFVTYSGDYLEKRAFIDPLPNINYPNEFIFFSLEDDKDDVYSTNCRQYNHTNTFKVYASRKRRSNNSDRSKALVDKEEHSRLIRDLYDYDISELSESLDNRLRFTASNLILFNQELQKKLSLTKTDTEILELIPEFTDKFKNTFLPSNYILEAEDIVLNLVFYNKPELISTEYEQSTPADSPDGLSLDLTSCTNLAQ